MLKDSLSTALAAPAAADPPRRVWRDAALVGVFVPAALLEGLLRPDLVWRPAAIVLAIWAICLLPFRRTHPLAVVVATFGVVIATDLVRLGVGVTDNDFGLYSMAILLILPFALFRWASGRDAAIGAVVVFSAAIVGFSTNTTTLGEAIAGLVILCVPLELGLLVRQNLTGRQRQLDEVRWREREQLARELHDTVAHHVSGIAVQAQAGRTIGPQNPAAALDALATIEEAASRTLIDMRNIVRALRTDDDADLSPQFGVDDLERLAGPAGPATPVTVRLAGDLDALSPATDAAVFRLAQEAVTNARRHAVNASTIDVCVTGSDRAVRVEITDDGLDARPNAQPGFGLVGMSERATLLGGTFTAGPRSQQGWAVVATLPRRGPA